MHSHTSWPKINTTSRPHKQRGEADRDRPLEEEA